MGQHYAFFAHFCAQNRAFLAIYDVPSNRLIPTFETLQHDKSGCSGNHFLFLLYNLIL